MIVWGLWLYGAACLWSQNQPADRTAREKANQLYRSASSLYLERRYAASADELVKSLELDPRQPRAAKLLGLCYQLTDRLDKAEAVFSQAAELDAKDPEVWFFLGRVYWVQNFFDKALPALETALRLDSRDARIHELLALTLEAQGQVSRALKEYEEAVRWNESRPSRMHTPHLNYGAFLHKLNRLEESEKQLLKSKALNPEDWQTRFELGKLYYDQFKLDRAADELQAALKASTVNGRDRARVGRILARVYYASGRELDAQAALARAEASEP